MKHLLYLSDPHRQSFLYFKWGFWRLLFFAAGVWGTFVHAQSPAVKAALDNIFVYLPNYLIHEFSHRFWCPLGWRWWCYASGNGVEMLTPLVLCFGALRLRGGRYLLPFLLYWLATAFYGAGIYAADARAGALPLTSSDMLSNFAPGVVKGDWHYILSPLGLLDYDVVIGKTLIFCACFCLVLAVWSLWYYWTNAEQYRTEGRWD